ncbi:MAG: hypothetical protein K940chlam9_01523 [Chlamydiae bacterium]|nr:hypothetical protein [Chlamydiota bacterium]
MNMPPDEDLILTSPVHQDSSTNIPDAPNSKRGGVDESSSSCWGRMFTSGKPSKKTLFMTASAVGLILFTIGLVALAGCYAPQTSTADWIKILHAAHKVTVAAASALATNPVLLSMIVLGIGSGLTFGGVAGAMVEKCRP